MQGEGEGIDFSPDGQTLAVAGDNGRVQLWDVETMRKLRELTDPAAVRADEPALAAAQYSPDGKVVAAGG
jgi:WD40 repeat protein